MTPTIDTINSKSAIWSQNPPPRLIPCRFTKKQPNGPRHFGHPLLPWSRKKNIKLNSLRAPCLVQMTLIREISPSYSPKTKRLKSTKEAKPSCLSISESRTQKPRTQKARKKKTQEKQHPCFSAKCTRNLHHANSKTCVREKLKTETS